MVELKLSDNDINLIFLNTSEVFLSIELRFKILVSFKELDSNKCNPRFNFIMNKECFLDLEVN